MITKKVLLTEQYKKCVEEAGLTSEEKREVVEFVAENADDGSVYLEWQQKELLTIRTLRWRDRFTVLYLSALEGRELYMLSLLEPKNPEPPSKSRSKKLMAFLEKIGAQLVIEAIKWLFRFIKDKEDVIDDLVSYEGDESNHLGNDIFKKREVARCYTNPYSEENNLRHSGLMGDQIFVNLNSRANYRRLPTINAASSIRTRASRFDVEQNFIISAQGMSVANGLVLENRRPLIS